RLPLLGSTDHVRRAAPRSKQAVARLGFELGGQFLHHLLDRIGSHEPDSSAHTDTEATATAVASTRDRNAARLMAGPARCHGWPALRTASPGNPGTAARPWATLPSRTRLPRRCSASAVPPATAPPP